MLFLPLISNKGIFFFATSENSGRETIAPRFFFRIPKTSIHMRTITCFSWSALCLSILLLSTYSCGKKTSRPVPASLSSYVFAYTSGVIARTEPIRVRFAGPVVDTGAVGQAAKGLITFSPAIEGRATWEDVYTLRFAPENMLPSGAEYIATVNLRKVYPDAPSEAASFDFTFRTREQFFQVKIDGLSPENYEELSRQVLEGQVLTTDAAKPELVERLLQASQPGADLRISWNHSSDLLAHDFSISGVRRGEKDSELTVSWDGRPLGLDSRDKQTIEVPAIDNFKVTRVDVVQEEDQHLLLHFSDPLLPGQDLSGLVTIDGYSGGLRFLIDGARLRLYPEQRLVGEQRIRVNPGIRNRAEKRLPSPAVWTVVLEEIAPQVRLVGNGVILPNSEGLLFPFEAVSLRAVEVEIFKIFNNNILQFLQNNDLDGSNQLHQVGRPILQRKVDLRDLSPGASTARWTRYALDLNQLVEQDPEAIYQVRIGFRQAYAAIQCGEEASDGNELTVLEEGQEAAEEINSIMDNWYGFEGYYEGYSWDQREDPCYPAYYHSDRFVSRNVIASNLGILAKGGKDQSFLVAVTDLRTADPVGDAAVEFYDFQQQLIGKGQTDGQGIALVQLERKPFVAVARQGAQKGYLRLQDGNALSLSRFDVSGAVTQRGLKGFLYADRGVWRPGDSVFLHFILEDRQNRLPAGYPVSFRLYDPRGQLQQQRTVAENVNNLYPLHFGTPPDAPTGNWLAEVKAGGASFNKTLKIETVKPNRIKIALDFGAEKLRAADEPFDVQLTANWLHGAPAADLEARVEVDLRAANTQFDRYGDFAFDDPARQLDSEPKVLFEDRLDGSGQARFAANLLGDADAPGRLTAHFKTRVFERGGNFSVDNQSRTYDPYTSYAGIALPRNRHQEKRVPLNESGQLQFVALDPAGSPVANRRLKVGLYRVEWRWWWENGNDNLTRYNTGNHYDALERQELVTDDRGQASWTVTPDEWGRYLVRVCDTESGHCSGDFFYAGYPWYGEDDNQYRQAAAMLSLSSDKDQYAVGESVQLTIPTGKVGRALISIEDGTRVLETFWKEAREGENTFRFRTTEEMAPNVYAHVTLIQPHRQADNDLPIRLYGVVPIKVEDPDTRLSPEIKMADELRPKQAFTVQVREKAGRPMAYTLAVVDEGLLSLTRFATPDPWASFYAREALGVRTWDVYDQVLGAYGGQLERLLSIGGDDALAPDAAAERANRFQPVVRHLGPFWLEKGQRAEHRLQMPNYVGAVRVMLVAADQGAYGHAEKSVPVRNPLMVLATLPRVLGPGESLSLPVNVFAMDKKVRDVTVEVAESSGLIEMTETRRSLRFSQTGDQLVSFGLQVKERTGVARFTVTASGGGETASQEIEIQVRNPNPIFTEVISQPIEPGQTWRTEFSPLGMLGTNEVLLEVSGIPPLNLGKRLDYLLRYPYGCLEQTLSSGFPQLYLAKLLELDEKQAQRVPRNIQATINRLNQFQTGAGGFSYWPGQGAPDHWASSYAGHFLLEARNLGYAAPGALLDDWIDFQQKTARMWSPDLEAYGYYSSRSQQLTQAYRLYTLALAGEPDLAAMNRLRETNNLGKAARWRLAAAYALAGKTDMGRQLIEGVDTRVDDYQELSYTFGSALRDRAMILETLVLLDRREQAGQLVRDLSQQLSAERWLSTQETAYTLLAIGKYVGGAEVQQAVSFAYQVGGGQRVEAGANRPVMQIQLPAESTEARSLTVHNPGNGILFARIVSRGRPVAGDQAARSNDLRMRVTYKDLNGNPIDPGRLEQGADFIAEVQVTHPGQRGIPYREMALNQVFPSGWEIVNTRMDNLQQFAESDPPKYRDFRDDRVYTFFDLPINETQVYRVQLTASYQGRFYLPPVSCEAMYDHTISASRPGQWVEVVRAGAS